MLLPILFIFSSFAKEKEFSKESLEIAQVLLDSPEKISRVIEKKIYSNSLFDPFRTYLELNKKVKHISNYQKYKFSCGENLNEIFYPPLKKLLKKKCLNNLIFNLLGHNTSSHLKYLLYQDIPFLLKEKKFLREILLKLTKEKSASFAILRKSLMNYFYIHNKRPSRRLRPLIKISNFKNMNSSKSSFYVFQKFLSIYKKQLRAINKKDFSNPNRLINFYNLQKNHLPRQQCWKIFITVGRKLNAFKQYALGQRLLEFSMRMALEKEFATSFFYYLWSDISNQKFYSAYKKIQQFNMLEKFDELDTRLTYWIGHILNKINKKELAREYFKQVIERKYLGYYAILAIKELSKEDRLPYSKVSYIYQQNKKISKNDIYTKRYLNGLKRLHIWSQLKNREFIQGELNNLLNLNVSQVYTSNDFLKNYSFNTLQSHSLKETSKVLLQYFNYLKSFQLIQKGMIANNLKVDKEILQLLFPTPYLKDLKKWGNNIDPLIILSLIRQESAFNPNAKSNMGARGLMQIMPNTARSISRYVTKKQLHNPNINLKIGIKYFKYLYKKYNKNLIYTLAAYNAGENNLRKWRKNIFGNKKFPYVVETIPFKETRLYVQLIYRNIFFYKLLQFGHVLKDPVKLSNIFDVAMEGHNL